MESDRDETRRRIDIAWMPHVYEAVLWLAAGVAMWRYASDLLDVWRTRDLLYDFRAYLAAAQGVVDG